MNDRLLFGFFLAAMFIALGIRELRTAYKGGWPAEEPVSLEKIPYSAGPVKMGVRKWLRFWAFCAIGVGTLALALCIGALLHGR